MDFEIQVRQAFTANPEKKYINDCCVGGDEILNKLKDEIASSMKMEVRNMTFYQEDWGWALEFSKNDFFYFLGISNLLEAHEDQTYFSVGTNAKRQVKKLIFNQLVEDDSESKKFSEIVKRSAEKAGFIIK